MSRSSRAMWSLRAANSRTHSWSVSFGPRSAATAPFCANEVALLVLWSCTVVIAAMTSFSPAA